VADTATCGAGTDSVSADIVDTVAADCETVTLPPPAVITGAATDVKKDKATLNGSINPNGNATTYHFEWGKTTGYGTSSPAGHLAAGTSPVAVSFNAGGLKPSTTYHFRLVATSSSGTTNGADAMFTTPAH
jgi:hypothetical protein